MNKNVYDESRWDFARFEESPSRYNRTSTAKAVKAKPKKKPDLKVLKGNKNKNVIVSSKTTTLKILFYSVLAAAILFTYVNGFVIHDEAVREHNRYQDELKIAEMNNIKLDSELKAKFSLRDIEDFALNELGMQKVGRNQVIYIDLNGEDEVILYDN